MQVKQALALSALNIMNLGSPQSVILSAIIFNALIIIALIPLALKGVQYKPVSANGPYRQPDDICRRRYYYSFYWNKAN